MFAQGRPTTGDGDATIDGGPLATPGDEFPLGPPTLWWEGAGDPPSTDPEVRPFSLRGVEEMPTTDPGTWSRHSKPGPTPAATSAVTDGDPRHPPPEEMGPPDFQSD